VPGPSNLYGVANPAILPVLAGMGAAVACPIGVETNLIDSGALIAPSSGYFYPVVFANITINYSSPATNVIIFGARIGAGSDFDSFGPPGPSVVAGAWQLIFHTFIGSPSNTVWQAPGAHIFITGNPNSQITTVSNFSTQAWFALYRAPDQ
jgi:hypothetical protein